MKKDFGKIKDRLDLAAIVFIFMGIIMQISFYPIVAVGVVWLLARTIIDVIESKVKNEI